MYRITWMITALAVVTAMDLTAQSPTGMAPGNRIRLSIPTLSNRPVTGTVVSLDAGRLVFQPELRARLAADSLPTGPWDIESIQVNRGPPTPWRIVAYGGVGLLAGAATGALIWPLVSSSACRPNNVAEERGTGCLEALVFDPKKRRDGAIMFGAIGALVGTIVGVLTNTPAWEVVPIDGITVTIAPTLAAPGIQGTLRF
jgi:hypothetical protein